MFVVVQTAILYMRVVQVETFETLSAETNQKIVLLCGLYLSSETESFENTWQQGNKNSRMRRYAMAPRFRFI
jgi:hypothetical protein